MSATAENQTRITSTQTVSTELFGELPVMMHGWVKHERDPERNLFEYWKKGSSHVQGDYQVIVAREYENADDESEIWLQQRCYDRFNHAVNDSIICRKSIEKTDWIWKRAVKKMERFPGDGMFTKPPEFPATVGNWNATKRRRERPIGTTVWEHTNSEATLTLEEVEMSGGYGPLTRYHDIHYEDGQTDKTTIAKEVPRKFAFEIAVNTMYSLNKPVCEMQEDLRGLQSIKGVGPAKSEYLAMLGIQSLGGLRTYITSESTPINRHHTDAVEKHLTRTIERELKG